MGRGGGTGLKCCIYLRLPCPEHPASDFLEVPFILAVYLRTVLLFRAGCA